MTETQRAALMAAEGAFRRYTHHHITKNDGEKAKANYALADMMAAALAEPEPAEVPFAYLPVNLPDVFTHNAGCTLWAGNPQNKTLSADNSMIAVYTRPQSREPLTDAEWLDYVLRHGTKTDVHIATYEGIATVGPMGKVIRLQTDANNLRKLVEKAHGIGEKP